MMHTSLFLCGIVFGGTIGRSRGTSFWRVGWPPWGVYALWVKISICINFEGDLSKSSRQRYMVRNHIYSALRKDRWYLWVLNKNGFILVKRNNKLCIEVTMRDRTDHWVCWDPDT